MLLSCCLQPSSSTRLPGPHTKRGFAFRASIRWVLTATLLRARLVAVPDFDHPVPSSVQEAPSPEAGCVPWADAAAVRHGLSNGAAMGVSGGTERPVSLGELDGFFGPPPPSGRVNTGGRQDDTPSLRRQFSSSPHCLSPASLVTKSQPGPLGKAAPPHHIGRCVSQNGRRKWRVTN